ncbi:MAG: hypothetical protein R3F17_12210 [Planctomycetota bacterium]
MSPRAWLAGLFLLCFAACGSEGSGPPYGPAAAAWHLAHVGQVRLDGESERLSEKDWQALAERLARTSGLAVHRGAEARGRAGRFLVGSPDDAALAPYLETLGLRRTENTWALGNLMVAAGHAWLVATLPDPKGHGLPVTLVCAEDPALLAYASRQVTLGTRLTARLYSNAWPVIQLELGPQGQPLPSRSRDLREWVNLPGARKELRRTTEGALRANFDAEIPEAHARAYCTAVEAAWQRAQTWLGPVPFKPSWRIDLIGHTDSWAFQSDSDRWALWDEPGKALTVLLPPGCMADGGARAVELGLLQQLGPSALPWLPRALAIDAADLYWNNSLDRVLSLLAGLPDLPDPAAWLGPEIEDQVSPHLVWPLRALLVRALREEQPAKLLELWRSGGIGEWKDYLPLAAERLGRAAGQRAWTSQVALQSLGLGVRLEGDWIPIVRAWRVKLRAAPLANSARRAWIRSPWCIIWWWMRRAPWCSRPRGRYPRVGRMCAAMFPSRPPCCARTCKAWRPDWNSNFGRVPPAPSGKT